MISSALATALGVFAGTNLDDIVVLTVLFLSARAVARPRPWQIWTGQYLGIAVLVAVSAVTALGLTVGSLHPYRYRDRLRIRRTHANLLDCHHDASDVPVGHVTLTLIARGRYHRVMAIDCAADLGPAVALFRSLGDPTRLAILQRLTRGEARVVDLTGELELAQSTVSKHLSCLRECGLIDFRVEGRQSFYALSRPELIDLLRSAEQVLAATGDAVALCPTYGVEREGAHAS